MVLQVPVGRIDPAVSRRLCFYVFTVAALGIVLGTIAATMDQFGLLAIPVLLIMMLFSGGTRGCGADYSCIAS
jgi:ABC-2 type transport system permease protein